MKRIDLHTHSAYSDGTLTPKELIKLASEKNISALALTDHDSMDGLYEARAASTERNVEVISGVELSAIIEGTEIHILGYFGGINDGSLHVWLTEQRKIRLERNLEMVEKLNENGVKVTYDELLSYSGNALITRIHFAKFLVEKKYAETINESFKKYLSPGCKTYAPKNTTSAEKCIKLIKDSKGVAVLAHPLRYGLDADEASAMVRNLTALGIDGIEAVYSSHNARDELAMKRLAAKYGLIITGGSDFHGRVDSPINLGDGTDKTMIPYSILEKLKCVGNWK